MDAWLEQIVKSFLEGEMKAGALTVGLRALDGVRRLVIVHHVLMVTGFLCALSLFAAGFEVCIGWNEFQWLAPPAILIYCLSIFVISAAILWYSCRSKTWVAAFGLQRQIHAAIRENRVSPTLSSTVDAEALAALVAKIVEQKLSAPPVAPTPTT